MAMLLGCVAVRAEWGVQLHCQAWPISARALLPSYAIYARVLHLSDFQQVTQSQVVVYIHFSVLFLISYFSTSKLKFFELKNVDYRDGIKTRRQDRDDYVHIMHLDNGNSQASLARVHHKPHNQPVLLPHHHTMTVKQMRYCR